MTSVRTTPVAPIAENKQHPDAQQTAEAAELTVVDLSKRQEGESDLMFALRQRHEDQAIKLLDRESNLDRTDTDGWTAVMYATYYGHYKILLKLISRGVNLNLMSLDGHTALSLAMYRRQKARETGDSTTIQVFDGIISTLTTYKANVNITIDGVSLLSNAISHQDIDLISYLLDNNALIIDPAALRSFLLSSSQLNPRVFFCFQILWQQHQDPADAKHLKILNFIQRMSPEHRHSLGFREIFPRQNYTTVLLTPSVTERNPERIVFFDLDDTGIDYKASEKTGEPVVLQRAVLDKILDTKKSVFVCITARPLSPSQLYGKLSALNLLRAVSDKFILLIFTNGYSKVPAIVDTCDFFQLPPSAACMFDDAAYNIDDIYYNGNGIIALPVSQKPHSMYGDMFQRFLTSDLYADPTYALYITAWSQIATLLGSEYDYSAPLKDIQNTQALIHKQLANTKAAVTQLKDLKSYAQFYNEANEILQAYQTMLDDLTVKSSKATVQEEIKSDAPTRKTSASSASIFTKLGGDLTRVAFSFLDPIDLVRAKKVSKKCKEIAEKSLCFTRQRFFFLADENVLCDSNHHAAEQYIPDHINKKLRIPTSHRRS